jgi:hypothetical protein
MTLDNPPLESHGPRFIYLSNFVIDVGFPQNPQDEA